MRSGKTPVVLMGKLFLCLWALVACAQELHWDKSMAAAGKARQEGRYSEAERLFIDAIKEVEGFGPGDPRLPASLNSLAELYRTRSKYAEAEALYKRALVIREKTLGADHPQVATSLHNLAVVYHDERNYAEAEPLYRRALAIWEKAGGMENPEAAATLNSLGELYRTQGKYAEAEPLYRRALAIWEKTGGPENPEAAATLSSLAELYRTQGKYAEIGRASCRER